MAFVAAHFDPSSKYFISVSSHLELPLEPLEFIHLAHIEAITYRTTKYTCGDQVLTMHHAPVAIRGHCLDRVPPQDRVLPPYSTFHECTYQFALEDWRGQKIGVLFVDEVQNYGLPEELPDNKGWVCPYEGSVYAGYFQEEVSLEEFKKVKKDYDCWKQQNPDRQEAFPS